MGRHTRALEAVNWRQCPTCQSRQFVGRPNLGIDADYTGEVAAQIRAWHDRIGNEMLLDFKRTTKPSTTNGGLTHGMEKQEP